MKKFEQIINSYITEEQVPTPGKGNDIANALENLKSAINAAAAIPFKKKGEILGNLDRLFSQLGGQSSSQTSSTNTSTTLGQGAALPQIQPMGGTSAPTFPTGSSQIA